jgi:hypothetical protein
MSRHPNSEQDQNIRIASESFEKVAKFKYLGTTLTNQNDIQNPLFSRLISKNLKIKIYKTVILPVVLYGCETWFLTLREKHRVRVFCEQRVEEDIWTLKGGRRTMEKIA